MVPATTKRLVFSAVLVTAVTMTACGDDADNTADSSNSSTTEQPADSDRSASTVASASGELDGTSYGSTSIVGRDLVPGSTVTLTFAAGDMTVVAGCNTIGGAYAVDDGTLSFTDEPRSTMMGCEDALAEQDQWLTTWLADGVTMARSEDRLTLQGDEVTIEFTAA